MSSTVDAPNPVSEFYKNYTFKADLPVISCSNYEDVLNKAKSVNSSCILYNKDKNIVTNKNLQINLTYDSKIDVVLVLNVELKGSSTLKISGKNFISQMVIKISKSPVSLLRLPLKI